MFYFRNITRKNFFPVCTFLCAALNEFHRLSLLLNWIEPIFLCLYSLMLQNKYHPIFSMRHNEQQISLCLVLQFVRASIFFNHVSASATLLATNFIVCVVT